MNNDFQQRRDKWKMVVVTVNSDTGKTRVFKIDQPGDVVPIDRLRTGCGNVPSNSNNNNKAAFGPIPPPVKTTSLAPSPLVPAFSSRAAPSLNL